MANYLIPANRELIRDFNNYEDIITAKICPYCGCGTEEVDAKDIYGSETMIKGKFYRCLINHDHYVGTYPDGRPYGRLADSELRPWKMKGHEKLEELLSLKIFRSQPAEYMWLSHKMGIERKYTHFGMFDIDQCKRAIELLEEQKKIMQDKNGNKS